MMLLHTLVAVATLLCSRVAGFLFAFAAVIHAGNRREPGRLLIVRLLRL